MKRLGELVLTLITLLLCSMEPALSADLIVFSVGWDQESDVFAGQQVTLIAEVGNMSSGFSSAVDVDFRIDGVSVGTGIIDAGEVAFGPEETRHVSVPWIAEAGEHVITVVADSTDEVEEDDEENNSLSDSLPYIGDARQVDLRVAGIRGPSEAVMKTGERTTLWADIQNSGPDSLAASFIVEFSVDGTAIGFEVIDTFETELAAGETIAVEHSWVPAVGGDCTVTAIVDAGEEVAETDEANNRFDTTLQVEAVDLQVASVTWDPADNLEEGMAVTFIATIRNEGPDSLAAAFTVNFAMDAVSLADLNVDILESPLGPGETMVVDVPATLKAGDQSVTVTVDSGNAVGETNEANNSLSADLPVIIDNNPPENISGLTVSASEKTALAFSWNHSANTIGDLEGYKAYFNGATEPDLLPATQTTLQKTGLSPAMAYDIRVTAYDHAGNESDGVSIAGYTVMENPADLIASSRPAFVDLSWEPSAPEAYVNHYAVYVSDTDFLSVAKMSPHATTTDTDITIGGLENGRVYYFAVVAVNLSGGMDEDVVTVSGSADAATLVRGDIRTDTTWTLDGSPYVVTGDVWVYKNSSEAATLTIEPGVEVRFETGTGLFVGYYKYHMGALVARGTSAQPIVFTSSAAIPEPGGWRGVIFGDKTDDATTVLDHCIVEYGGQTYNADIYCGGSSPTIRNSTIRHSSANGIYLTGNSSPVIGGEDSGNLFSHNGTYGINSNATSPLPAITHNTLSDNGSYAMRLRPQMADVSHNTGRGNGIDGIELFGEALRADTVWQPNDLPYVVTGDVTVYKNSGEAAILTIEPGVEVRFSPGTGLFVGYYNYHMGALVARGTIADPIVFTSGAATPAPGDWKGIYFHDKTDDATTLLEYCIVEYGGHTNNANVICASASPTIRNSTIRHSSTNGIYLTGNSSPVIGGEDSGNTVIDNGTYGISSNATSPLPAVTHNTLSDNGSYAMRLRPQMADVSHNTGTGNGIDGIEIFGEALRADTVWQPNGLPYVVTGDVTVYKNSGEAATLTIEPGVEMRFVSGAGLFVGYYNYHMGALVARGTIADPIVFTSGATTPAPGDWKGIYFHDKTDDATTLLEHCIVEYGGHTNNADIHLSSAAPTLRYNTLRNSGHSGIYATGDGSDGAVISCNNFKDNRYGVYTAGNAQPDVSGNNFLGNRNCGVHNAHTQAVTANDNWWGDANGPNTNGDATFGPVTADTWLTAESDCILTPPTNSPPFAPRSPIPADNAVRVPVLEEGQAVPVTLSWAGGDPNPWDTVVYDIYFGKAADGLSLAAESLEEPTWNTGNLTGGTTFFWQVVSRDDAGGETAGPVWRFTTLGAPPDLEVTQLSWDPADNLVAGQAVSFTATITNSGTGPAVDSFPVAFAIDGLTVGTSTVNPVIPAGETRQVPCTWTATRGSHTLTVTADSTGAVDESYEENNTLSLAMPVVVDNEPPVLVASTPVNGASIQSLSAITFTLSDAHGAVDDDAVIASVVLIDGSGQAAAGTTVENSDRFTFTPASQPLADGTYTLSFDAVDDSGNTAHFSFTFTLDGLVPAAPLITGGEVLSGILATRPAENRANTTTINITGTREENTSLWVDGSLKVASGGGDWSTSVTLSQGANTLEIRSQDAAGNHSDAVFVDIKADSVAPSISGAFPADDSFLAAPPAALTISYTEAGSGLNRSACTTSFKDADLGDVPGAWDFSTAGTIAFTPSSLLVDGGYTLTVQLEDNFTNQSSTLNRRFTVDTVAPDAPVIDGVASPTHNPGQTISGTKEAFAAITMNGTEIVGHTEETIWQHTATLASGENTFAFAARDRAGNTSDTATAVIVFDDIAPEPVSTLTVDGRGSGTEALLAWPGYNEAAHGDVASYRIYWQENEAFNNVAGMTAGATVPAGTFSCTAVGLTRGATVWFAVTAVDAMGNSDPSVTAVSAVMTDIQAPENVTGLSIQSFEKRLVVSWNASADSAGDLAGYRVYVDGSTEFTALASDLRTFELTGLAVASAHSFTISAVDSMAEPNQSSGASITGVTWLPNPAGLAAEPFSGYVQLAWSDVQPSAYIKQYRVYVSESAFSDVAGMSPAVTAAGTTARVAGLTNGTPYWFAVTTVNTSDGQRPDVVAVSATPAADELGPEITTVQAGAGAFADGYELTGAVTLSLAAEDPSGVSRVEFYLDGSLIRTDYSAPYTCYLNPSDLADGTHQLAITAYDTIGNSQSVTIGFSVALAVPAVPAISSPATGTTTNKAQTVVSGQADRDTRVQLYNNDLGVGLAAAVDGQGYFSRVITLSEGENRIQATAINRAGEGPRCDAVTVTLDTTLPSAPGAVTARAGEGGVIRVSWQKPSDTAVAGYHLYRHSAPFSDVAQAVKVNSRPITADRLDDVPPTDGTWYYRGTTQDAAGNRSEPSNEASADADGTAPRADAIVYTTAGPFDPGSGAMAPGTVDLVLTVTEALQAKPFLSITPAGGAPISVDLVKTGELTYSGFFVITDTTPGGTAWAIFSGRDMAGNRGTEIDAGATIMIDTAGPAVSRLVVTPESPIQNDGENPVSVTAVIGLSEAVKEGTVPYIGYLLSGADRQATTVDSLTMLETATGDAQTWKAVFALPADAGLAEAESFSLIYEAADHLDNMSDRIDADNRFQVYQGELPPLAVPGGLTAVPMADGKVQLTWNEVDEATGTMVYRQGPDETELTALVRVDDEIQATDATDEDGYYTYAVASIRAENGQEAESGLSETVTVYADSVAPGAPKDFSLELVANGIKAQWTAPAYTEPITYRLYRSPATEITDVSGLEPLAENIDQTLAVDPNPSQDDHCYTVTAVDEAGNQSPPASSAYLNFQLLPVSSLRVVQTGNDPPVISWNHGGDAIAGYHLYLGSAAEGVHLNDSLISGRSYTDTGWAGDTRSYTVVAVDTGDVASLGRSIVLPVIRVALGGDTRVRRGVMNRLPYTVENLSGLDVSGVRLRVDLGGRAHWSETFTLAPQETKNVNVVAGGYEELTDPADLTTTVEITPAVNERVEIVRHGQVAVGEGMLVLRILNEEFTRGGSGTVWFSLENTGDEEIEIVTARNSGNADSDQISVTLEDEDGNVITVGAFCQAVGENIVTLSDKTSVARIGAGEIFTARPIRIRVPSTAPDNVTLHLAVSDVYYQRGRDTQVRMDGLSTTHAVTLAETAYTGAVDAIAPQTSSGDEEITISGRALDRATGDPVAGVPLKLVISHNGFVRNFEVYTDGDGTFAHNYTPEAGEAGVFQVRAVHPDVTDTPVHGQFVVSRVSVSPATINLNIPRNYDHTITVRVAAGAGTDAGNLRLEYLAADQADGVFLAGIHLTPGIPVPALNGGDTADLGFTLWADNTASQTGTLVLRVASDENERWATVTIHAGFSDARPVLGFTPDHMETGMAAGESVTEILTLTNKGLAPMTDVTVSLLAEDGSRAPAWAVLNTSGDLGQLEVGDAREVAVTFSPDVSVAEGIYRLVFRVAASNHDRTDIHLYALVVRDGIGSAMFKVVDIYTGTLDDSLQVIQGLAGARVVLQNEAVDTETFSRTCDGAGEALFSDLPAGRYKVRVTAKNHQEYIGRLWVKPGITSTEDVFLEYNLVTVEWSVNEITIQDEYEIVLTATYETEVPAPVVVIEPASFTLPPMQAGDVLNGEFTLTNYGLIRANDLAFHMPQGDAYFRFELAGSLPTALNAKARVTIPYRITCLQALEPDMDGTGGGACGNYLTCATVNYSYCCAAGHCTTASVRHCWTRSWGDCSSGCCGGSTGGHYINIGTGGGGGVGYTPPGKPVNGLKCFPEPDRKESFCDTCPTKDTLKHFFQPTGSAVNLWMREYSREHTDLSVKVPGGSIEAGRRYYGGAWHFEHLRHNLAFIRRTIGTGIQSIRKGGVAYDAATSASEVFVHGTYRIVPTDTGYRWTDTDGNWKAFDTNGRMTARGGRTGTIETLVYDDSGRLTGVLDRNGGQVLWYEYDGPGFRVMAISDAAGRRVAYEYEEDVPVISDGSRTSGGGSTETVVFDSPGTVNGSTAGWISRVIDPEGHETAYGYDGRGRLFRTTDAEGRSYAVAYDEYGHVAAVTDDDGQGWFFEYDYDNARKEAWVRTTSSSGMIRETWYDRNGETRRVDVNGRTVMSILKDGRDELVTGENGRMTRKNYDQWDNLTAVIHPDGSRAATTYDLRFNRPFESIDENGHVTRNTYDGAGNLVRKVEAAGTDDERVTEYTYDDDGNLLTITRLADDATALSRTVMTYDEKGNLTSVTDPAGGVTQFTAHDIMGNVLEKIDARGKTWTYNYDNLGRLRTITDPLGSVTGHFHDATGNRISTVDAEGRETAFFYDNHDNLIRRVDHEGKETLFEYNSDNKLVQQTDPAGNAIRYSYDNEGLLTRTVDGHGDAITVEYDDATATGCASCSGATGSLPSRTVYPTFEKSYTYDSRNRKVSEADRLDDATTWHTGFAYDAVGNLISRTDKMSRTTWYAYDAVNRLAAVTDPAGGVTRYTYDDRDNLIELTDAEDQTTRFAYDGNNRLVKEIRPRGAETVYAYDGAGNLIEKIDAKNQKAEYFYDDAGRLVTIRYFATTGDSAPAKTVTFTYDKVGNLTGYDDGTTSAVYEYDTLYRKTTETVNYGAFSLAGGYAYYDNGLKKTWTGPDAITYGYLYDANNQLTGVQIPDAGFITMGQYHWNRPASMILPGGGTKEFDYDSLMRIRQITSKDPAANDVLNYGYEYDRMDNITGKTTEHGNYAYDYDDLYRLTGADNPVRANEAFTYDGVGNRLTSADTSNEWAYNENNELTGYDDVTFAYDLNGNMIEKSAGGVVTRFFYNLEDRLARVEDGSGNVIASYYYDPFGRRLWKDVGGVRTHFHYSDEGLVGEYDATGTVIKTYGYKPGSTWSTDPLFVKLGSEYYFYHNDHLGTPQKMTSVSGAVVWYATYSSFGNAEIATSSTIINNLRFPGQYFDAETGLHYNWNRHYSTIAGRYITVDPIGIYGGINFYLYAKVNPNKHKDIEGLRTCGSGWNEWLVPDNPFGFQFSDCCEEHDKCYGTCGKSQSQCDNDFESCMLSKCDGINRPMRKSVCKTQARRYAGAVKSMGKSAFENAQKKCECAAN